MVGESYFLNVVLKMDGDMYIFVVEERSSKEEVVEQHPYVVHLVSEAFPLVFDKMDLLVEKLLVCIIKSQLTVSKLPQKQSAGGLSLEAQHKGAEVHLRHHCSHLIVKVVDLLEDIG